jgi:phosphoribosylanthranilate isomerase
MSVLVKICGITNEADARLAVDAGADFLGFILVPGTPRCVAPESAAEIIRALRGGKAEGRRQKAELGGEQATLAKTPGSLSHWVTESHPVRFVGVFLDVPEAEIRAAVELCGFDIIQLHGEEPAELATQLRPERVWKMMHLRTPQDVALAVDYPAVAILADTVSGGRRGGTGRIGDWPLAAELAKRRKVVLAGGLNPDNVAEAVRQVRPWALDVGSGVEAAPGRKDEAKVRAFIKNAKAG